MSDTHSDYIRTHDLRRKYGTGLLIVALFALRAMLNGGGGALVTLKILVGIPFAISWVFLGQIYNRERSNTPFTPSFVERTALEGVLLGAAVAVVNWTPASNPIAIVLSVLLAAMFYFGIRSVIYRHISRPR